MRSRTHVHIFRTLKIHTIVMEPEHAVARKKPTLVLLTIGSLWLSRHNNDCYLKVTRVTNTDVFYDVYDMYTHKHDGSRKISIRYFLNNRIPFLLDEI